MSNTTNYGWAYVHPTLGIGITRGPEKSLTFQNSANADIDSNGMGSASGSANLTFDSSTNSLALAGSAAITLNHGTNVPLTIRQDGNGDILNVLDGASEVFTIINGGNVGIGIATPTEKLHVDGNLLITGDLTVNGTNTVLDTTTMTVEDKDIVIANVSTPTNTTADGAGIIVKGATDKTWTWVQADLAWTSSEHIKAVGGKHVMTDKIRALDADGLYLQDDGGNGIFIKDGGDIGIGTASPEEPLHIVSAGNGGVEIENTSGAPTLTFDMPGNQESRILFKEASEYRASIVWDSEAPNPHHMIFKGKGTNTEVMRIDPAGNLGVGTATPTTKLEVAGTIKATALTLGSAEISETELEILDGATVTTAELNVLSGIPAGLTTTELGYVDGVTSAIQTQLDGKQPLDSELTTLAGMSGAQATAIASLSQSEIEVLDDALPNTVANNKAAIYGASGELAGTLSTAAQPNVTSVGTLSSLKITGDVGIGDGITTPEATLHLKNSTASQPVVLIEDTHGGTNPTFLKFKRSTLTPADADSIAQIEFRSTNDATSAEDILYAYIGTRSDDITDGTEDGSIEFAAMVNGSYSNSNNMFLKGGNLGVGTNAPSTKLQVAGTVTATTFAGNLTGNADTATTAGTVTTAAQTAITSVGTLSSLTVAADLTVATDTLYVDSADYRVGIGTTNPQEPLHVVTNANGGIEIEATSGAASLIFDMASNDEGRLIFKEASEFRGSIIYDGTGAHSIVFKGKGTNTEIMRLNNQGNLGIGNNNPNEKLTVEGAISLDHISAPGHTAGYGKLYAKSDNNLYFKDATGTETNLVTAGGGGSVYNTKILNDPAVSTNTAVSITHGSGAGQFDDNDYFLAIKTSNSNNQVITITLPDPSTRVGKVYLIKDITGHAGHNNITIATAGGGVVEPSSGVAVTLNSNKAAVQCIALGSNWHLF